MSKSMHGTPFETMRIGVVSSVDLKKCTARVVFEDRSDVVSPDFPVMQKNTMNCKHYWMPHVGETVVCLYFSNGQESGIIIGSVYSDVDNPVPEISDEGKDRDGVWFEDGTIIKYEPDTKTLVVDCVGEINITAKRPINILAESDVFLDGTLYVTEDVIADSVSLVHHVHTCPHGTTSEPLKG